MNDIIFQKLVSTKDGVGATTGKQTETAFNENFDLVKQLFSEVLACLSIAVTSEQLKQIRVDTSTNPYTLYYSLDDESVTNPTWIKLLSFSFASLTGSPMDNIALKTILDGKASQDTINTLTLQINGLSTSITDLQAIDQELRDADAALSKVDENLAKADEALAAKDRELAQADANLQNQINDANTHIQTLENATSNTVYTEEGSVLWIKYNVSAKELQISEDRGTTWIPVGTLNTNWTAISGDPSKNSDLVNYVTTAINAGLSKVITLDVLNEHTKNYNNPHNVTATQLGLGNIADLIADLEGSESSIVYCNPSSLVYNISQIPLNKAYFTSSHFGRAPLSIEASDYFEYVKSIGSTETYTGPDGFNITQDIYYNDFDSIPAYYKCNINLDDSDKIDIYYNETLYNYIKAGGELK